MLFIIVMPNGDGFAEQVWKRDMLAQLEAVAVAEREAQETRVNEERQQELEAWRERRREQLERLIEVRKGAL